MSYFTHIKQNVVADDGNSLIAGIGSGSNLTAGSSWTGNLASTLGVAGIQVSLKTDQNCTVEIQQSPDGSNWDLVDSYHYFAGANFGITVQAISSYVKIKLTNTGLATTTYIRLQTALCPIVEAVPRSLDEHGHFRVAIQHSEDRYGFEVENTPQGEMRVLSPIKLIGAQFDLNGNAGAVDSNFWLTSVASAGTVTQANAQVILACSSNSADSAKLYSVRRPRYIGGHALRYRANIQLSDTGVTNNTRRWGVAYGSSMPTLTDGAWFQLSGTTFSLIITKAGSPTTIANGAFNGTLGVTWPPVSTLNTNLVYEIYWTNAKVYFVIRGELLHTFTASTTTWAATLMPYIYMDNINSGTSTASSLYSRNSVIHRIGPMESAPQYKYIHGVVTGQVLKYGPGRLHKVILNSLVNGSTVTIYDAVSGFAAGNTLAAVVISQNSATQPQALDYNLDFYNGLAISTVNAATDVTIVYE